MHNLRPMILFPFLLCLGCVNFGQSKNIDQKIDQRADGGYSISLRGTIRELQLVSAEGFFPTHQLNCVITLEGKGQNMSLRGQHGSIYTFPGEVTFDRKYADLGYAWVNKERDTIYLNFFWAKPPRSFINSEVNGSYKLKP